MKQPIAALEASDVVSAQVVIQLGLLPEAEVCRVLKELSGDPHSLRDLVNRLADRGRLSEDDAELVRHRTALYMHVWAEDSYIRHLEIRCKIPKVVVADMLIELERSAYRKRLGAELVQARKLTPELDRSLQTQSQASLLVQQQQTVEYHRSREFAEIGQPLIDGSDLDPSDFKISALFRSRKTMALVDSRRLAALRKEADRSAAARREDLLDTEAIARPVLPDPIPDPIPDPVPVPASSSAKESVHAERLDALETIADYDVVEKLGEGGMGAVYLCRGQGDGAYCAVKVLLPDASDVDRGRFKREIELTAQVNHPNVIALLDSGETDDGVSYMVVPSLFGKELRHYLQAANGCGLPPRMVCEVMEQLLEALQAVHDAGIVHRDLKPENVFVIAGGQHKIQLLDFGVAKYQQEKMREGSAFRTQGRVIVGTPAYLSPDAITNDKIDGRTDLYSLGVMFFEMLTGKLPLTSATPEGFVGQHLICPPMTLEQAQPETEWPEALEALLAKMLAKGRKKRPESCNAILEQLRGGLSEAIGGLIGDDEAAQTIVDLDGEQTRGTLELAGRLFS